MAAYRLPSGGTSIDRGAPLQFTYDGKVLEGFAGDTLASALLANGRMVVARSFKYHRPRGVFSAGHEEPNALVTLRSGGRTEPNAKAPATELYDGLEARSQNAWPSPRFDLMAVNQLAAPLFVAGFYYKTFMGTGQRFWHFCERFIRRAAGMGAAGSEADPDRYERANLFADVLVIGGGAAGVAAARAAASFGRKVLLVDENTAIGGAMPEDAGTIDGHEPAEWAAQALDGLNNVTVMPRTTVYGYFDDNVLGAVERVADHVASPGAGQPRLRHLKIYAGKVVIAAGSIERPLVFAGNDKPGVMLAQAGLRYAYRHGVAVGRKVVITGNNDSIYAAAASLASLGVSVTALVDMRSDPPAELVARVEALGLRCLAGRAVFRAKGFQSLKSVEIAPFVAGEVETDRSIRLDCDALLVSGGFTPMVNLCSQAGTPPVYDPAIDGFLPGQPLQDWTAAGAASGAMDLAAAVASGHAAGCAVGGAGAFPAPNVTGSAAQANPGAPACIAAPGKSFVDLQHDVTVKDIELAHREGFRSIEHVKRYTTLGMAADQGKTSNVNAIALMAGLQGLSPDQVGTTRFRPPYTPVALGALAGREVGQDFKPVRRTPMHDWHVAHGAEMIDAGTWVRPRVYRTHAGESLFDAYVREARAVRASVGIVDVTTLGKIDVQGPDAAEFLNRLYANPFLKVPVGKARYGAMLREDGILYDDGTTWRLAEDRFLTTTTTARAAGVLAEMERLLAVEWPELQVQVTSVSDQWAAMAVAGPNARRTLQKILEGLDIDNEAFPSMAVGKGRIGDCDVMVARLSFSGELAYEVYCGSGDGTRVWEAIMAAGEEFSITPYGTEALGTLRIEKGHISGPELDGRTTLDDIGLGKMASRTKAYVGSVLLDREGLTAEDRLQLVGLVSTGRKALRAGAQIVDPAAPGNALGHVSSTTFSPALDEFIALALVSGGRARIGEEMLARFPLADQSDPVRLVDPVFFDPQGERMHG
ncbi:sarcosine oxidase subunit alpha family protein [Paraurantiacibacter namhicola]|uniref:Aminomethyltransferase n=1 Tax=Paraurantiacibacter namhicola TaxID=645517 RepID=A0A1C7D551_9SPHN|nr:sarcosine oxidase subunit alpha family protein [Paraurantiacibacter namhicola]ANU06433.1 Aminomethyltransferase [Paraurantiacibacter namhicola]